MSLAADFKSVYHCQISRLQKKIKAFQGDNWKCENTEHFESLRMRMHAFHPVVLYVETVTPAL